MAKRTAAGITKPLTLALALSAASICSTAFAANSSSIICDEVADTVNDRVAERIAASPAAHDQDLTPLAEALINDAFEHGSDDAIAADQAESDTEVEEAEVTVALPGVSDAQIRIYRDQMYRTDI